MRKRPAAIQAASDTDILGGRDPNVPELVHERMLLLVAKGTFPKTIPIQRQKNLGTQKSVYGVPPELAEARRFGYIGPNLPAPLGMRWVCRSSKWSLAPSGG